MGGHPSIVLAADVGIPAASVTVFANSEMVRRRAYLAAIIFAIGFSLLHLISLPIGITYDGFHYLDMADVLGSARFPADWYWTRTPLYPLSLKLSFWLLGHQALAVIFVNTALGLGTTLTLGRVARTLAGAWAGAAVLIVLTLYPTAVAYQHLALTETGTSFFLALLIAVSLWDTRTKKDCWKRTIALCLVLAAGYYWRQLLLQLALVAASLHVGRAWRSQRFISPLITRADLISWGLQAALIIVVPTGLSHLWDPYIDRTGLTEVSLSQGMVRQALFAPTDPIVGPKKDQYVQAIRDSLDNGSFFSGVRAELMDVLLERGFLTWPQGSSARAVFINAARLHPERYAAGVFRTIVLFAGVKARVNENLIFREHILSPTWTGSKIGEGPPNLQAKIKGLYQQVTTSSAVGRLLSRLCPLYDFSLVFANITTVLALLYAGITRRLKLVALTVFPVTYVAFYAVILASIDRFALPAYPATLTAMIVLPALCLNSINERRRALDKSREPQPS
jgi:hypothetical protein